MTTASERSVDDTLTSTRVVVGKKFDGSERENDHVVTINKHTQVGVFNGLMLLASFSLPFSYILFCIRWLEHTKLLKKSTDGEAPKKVIGASETKSTKRPRSELDGKAENTEQQASTTSINTPNCFD